MSFLLPLFEIQKMLFRFIHSLYEIYVYTFGARAASRIRGKCYFVYIFNFVPTIFEQTPKMLQQNMYRRPHFFINGFSIHQQTQNDIFTRWMGAFQLGRFTREMHKYIHNRFTWLRDPTSIFSNRIYTVVFILFFAFIFAVKHSFFPVGKRRQEPFWLRNIDIYV